MKRIVTIAALLTCMIVHGYGQTVYGGDFEQWRYNAAKNVHAPINSMFSTLDTLVTVGSGTTAYPSDTAHSGLHSAGLITSQISALHVLIPGVIGTIKIDWLHEKAILGIPYPYGNTQPVRFTGFYKSYPLSNDSSAVVIRLSKWNSGLGRRDTIAYNRIVFHGTVDSWTAFDTAVTYRLLSTTPDTLLILMLSCGGFNATNMFGSVGQIGSKALFDDVNLTGVNGFPIMLMPDVSVRLSPNPAKDHLNILLGEQVSNGYFEVYDAQARLIRRYPVAGTTNQIDLGGYTAGMYYYKLTGQNKTLNSGTFAVTK
jgi:hypothetical protein